MAARGGQVHLRPLQLQWNPETVANLQAFLSGQRGVTGSRPSPTKGSRAASMGSRASSQPAAPSSPGDSCCSTAGSDRAEAVEGRPDDVPVRLRARTGELTLLLNKEGEQRRMLDLRIAEAEVRFHAQVSPQLQACIRASRLARCPTVPTVLRVSCLPGQDQGAGGPASRPAGHRPVQPRHRLPARAAGHRQRTRARAH